MNRQNSLALTLLLASLGLALSGYLSYWNLWGPSCHEGPLSWLVTCGGSNKVLIFGLPTCVYGFFMYLAVATTAIVGLLGKNPRNVMTTLAVIGTAGTLFAGGLTVYEIAVLKLTFATVPACVYGLVLYAGVLTLSLLQLKKIRTHVL